MKLYDFQAKTHTVIYAKNIEEAKFIGKKELDSLDEYFSYDDDVNIVEICNEDQIPPGWGGGCPYGNFEFDTTISEYFKLPKPNIVEINGKKYKMVEVEE